MPSFKPKFSNLTHGQIILGAGVVDSSLVEDIGLIETIDLPICGISALERILFRDEQNLPTWIHLKSPDSSFESYLISKFPNIIGFSYSSGESAEGLRISALISIKKSTQFFSAIDLVFADTWQDIPKASDVISIQSGLSNSIYTCVSRGIHNRLEFKENKGYPFVTGYFRFSNPNLFLKLLQNQEDNGATGFYGAITDYDKNLEGEVELEVAKNWFDFGHKQSFYKSRRYWLFGRSFNSLTASEELDRITKSSIHEEKLIQEFNWYKKLPPELAHYTPKVWGIEGKSSYEIEFLPAPSLAETLVFGNKSIGFWDNAMTEIGKYFSTANQISFDGLDESDFDVAMEEMYIKKVVERIESLRSSYEFNEFADNLNPFKKKLSFRGKELPKLDEVLENYLSLVKKEITIKNQSAKFIHGDLCFGNMVYNNDILKIFDPRGTFGKMKIAGDIYYDYAKLAHSIFGEYDYYAFDRFILNRSKTGYEATPIKKGDSENILNFLRNNFLDISLKHSFDIRRVKIIMAGLFLSLASLHKESPERQISLLMIGMSEINDLTEVGYR
jgi:hypothetical protein